MRERVNAMDKPQHKPKGEQPSPALQRAIRRLLAEAGEAGAVERLGISRQTLGRLAGGMSVQRVTIAAVTARLGLVSTEGAQG
jgi:hypothetical protein